MTKTLHETAVVLGLVICVLAIALTSYAPSYYVLLRFMVCVLCAYLAVAAYQQGKFNSAWVFGVLMVLFNPLVPVRLSRDVWTDVYIATILLMGLMLWNLFWRNRVPKSTNSEVPQEDDPLASFLGVQKRRVSQTNS